MVGQGKGAIMERASTTAIVAMAATFQALMAHNLAPELSRYATAAMQPHTPVPS